MAALMREQLVYFCHTHEGSKVAFKLYSYATAKVLSYIQKFSDDCEGSQSSLEVNEGLRGKNLHGRICTYSDT